MGCWMIGKMNWMQIEVKCFLSTVQQFKVEPSTVAPKHQRRENWGRRCIRIKCCCLCCHWIGSDQWPILHAKQKHFREIPKIWRFRSVIYLWQSSSSNSINNGLLSVESFARVCITFSVGDLIFFLFSAGRKWTWNWHTNAALGPLSFAFILLFIFGKSAFCVVVFSHVRSYPLQTTRRHIREATFRFMFI